MLLFILGTLAAGILVAAGPQMAASNDTPVINGSTATSSNNHLTQNQTNIYHIVVNNLTTDVGSSGNAVPV